MRGNFGEHYKLSIFGESHGPGIGIVIDGIPAGTPIDEAEIARYMARRAPGRDPTATARAEADQVEILSGVLNGHACGTPVCGIIRNTNTRSSDYSALRFTMRPGHADYAGFIKYAGFNDPRGGGHFSGRLTAPLVFAGSIARSILKARGIRIGSHILSIGPVRDEAFDPVHLDPASLTALEFTSFPLLDAGVESDMRAHVAQARESLDSVGGMIECAATGVPAGIGSPFFGSVESVFASLAFSVPAVKAVEFGDGTHMADLHGSEANDALTYSGSTVTALTNHNGGVTGGITNGMPVLTRVTIKPTPSIARAQTTVDLSTASDTTLEIKGRHDPCIVPRAAVVIESILAITLLELMMDDMTARSEPIQMPSER
ncbi:MAG: chorismate synthase [Clostridia bacterium]|nr:chorismate synthase [Clostridia bacterium]